MRQILQDTQIKTLPEAREWAGLVGGRLEAPGRNLESREVWARTYMKLSQD